MNRPRSRLVAPLGFAAVAIALYFLPFTWPCPLRMLVGVPCPACGLTRATRLAVTGHVAAASAMHPLVWVVVPMLAAYALAENVGYLRTGTWGHAKKLPLARVVFYALVGSVFVLWVARFFGACGGPVPV